MKHRWNSMTCGLPLPVLIYALSTVLAWQLRCGWDIDYYATFITFESAIIIQNIAFIIAGWARAKKYDLPVIYAGFISVGISVYCVYLLADFLFTIIFMNISMLGACINACLGVEIAEPSCTYQPIYIIFFVEPRIHVE